MHSFFVTAARGTEGALRDELREARFRAVRATRGGVGFSGELLDGVRACLETRVGVRVMLHLATVEARDDAALYAGVRELAWEDWMRLSDTLAVRATLSKSALTHAQFVSRRVKDAVVDRFRDRAGARPDVDAKDPVIPISVHVVGERADVYLELSGAPLFLRGYRPEAGEAPLKETLAAAIVRLSGWRPGMPMLDPMCGSGTLAVEAALWAAGRAPGVARAFACERWERLSDAASAAEIARLREAGEGDRRGADVFASDVDPRMIELTRRSARRAGVIVRTRVAALRDVDVPIDRPGWVITNPPYGERLQRDDALPRDLAALLAHLPGWSLAVIWAGEDPTRLVRGDRRPPHELFNGDLRAMLTRIER